MTIHLKDMSQKTYTKNNSLYWSSFYFCMKSPLTVRIIEETFCIVTFSSTGLLDVLY